MSPILALGMQGVRSGIGLADQAAGQIARVDSNLQSGDLATSIVNLIIGELQVKSSAQVIKTGDQMLGTIIDIFA